MHTVVYKAVSCIVEQTLRSSHLFLKDLVSFLTHYDNEVNKTLNPFFSLWKYWRLNYYVNVNFQS